MATKSQSHLIRLAGRNGKVALAVHLCILANLDGCAGPEGHGFFIDNARGDALTLAGLSAHQFAGGLAALEKEGKYAPSTDPTFRGQYGYLILQASE